jgi:HD-GYP domain-containing protein (c-di-GMP phosphodiesterase class II)
MKAQCSYIPISIATLTDGAMLGLDIYQRLQPGLPATLLFSRNEPIDLHQLPAPNSCVNRRVLICRQDRDQYEQYLKNNWGRILDDPNVPVANRLSVMNEVVRDVMNGEFHQGDIQSIVSSANEVAENTVRFLNSGQLHLRQLSEVLHHDYTTFTHSTNVSFYCTLLAGHLGYSQQEQKEIAIGGLLHDLGKLEISERILKKPDRLNWEEYCLLQRHPITGFEKLADNEEVSFGQLMMAYQHHERIDGSGYPCGVRGSDIHPWAKICAVVDVFEAITSERPYRVPLSNSEAAELLDKGRGREFDTEMLDAWLEIIMQSERLDVTRSHRTTVSVVA